MIVRFYTETLCRITIEFEMREGRGTSLLPVEVGHAKHHINERISKLGLAHRGLRRGVASRVPGDSLSGGTTRVFDPNRRRAFSSSRDLLSRGRHLPTPARLRAQGHCRRDHRGQMLGRRSPAVNVAVAEAVFASDRPRAKVRSGPDASVDDRIALHEKQIDKLEDELWTLQDTIDRDREQFNNALGAEKHAREDGFKALQHRVTSLAVGGIRLQTVGLGWLFLGVVGTTWSQELA
jgi:hypothetical protein